MSDQSNIQEQQHVAFGLPQDNPKQMKHVPDNFDNRSKTKSAGALWLFFKSTMSPPRKKLRRRENGTCIGMYVRIKVFRGGMGVNIFKFEMSCNPLQSRNEMKMMNIPACAAFLASRVPQKMRHHRTILLSFASSLRTASRAKRVNDSEVATGKKKERLGDHGPPGPYK